MNKAENKKYPDQTNKDDGYDFGPKILDKNGIISVAQIQAKAGKPLLKKRKVSLSKVIGISHGNDMFTLLLQNKGKRNFLGIIINTMS